jgi:TatD DNase family protein
MELIDTHCHLTFEQLAGDVEAVLKRSIEAGVTGWITVGTDKNENKKVLELCGRFENLYAAVGIHPHEAKQAADSDIQFLRKFAENPKVVALGETGLDYHYDFSPPQMQKKLFAAHLEIAAELDKPVVIHSRESFDDTIEILGQSPVKPEKVVFHCFSYSPQQAKLLLDKGFYISFTGVVTFKNAELTRQAAKIVPPEKMMIETDSPYMSPEPMRKQKVNEPALLIHTARFLAELKQIPFIDFAQMIANTSRTFFSLPLR